MRGKWKGRVRRAWEKVRRKRVAHEEPFSFSRRNFLKGAGAVAVLAALNSCVVESRLTSEETALARRAERFAKLRRIRTALREGKSVVMAIEANRHRLKRELGFYKVRPGEIIATDTVGSSWGISLPVYPAPRSTIHTHFPTDGDRSTSAMAILSNPSIQDAMGFHMSAGIPGGEKINLKFDHVAAINHEGQVMGFFSLMIGKKMASHFNPQSKKELAEARALFSGIARIKEYRNTLDKLRDRYAIALTESEKEKIFTIFGEEYLRCMSWIAYLHDLGLRMRVTPVRKDYVYRDGYFQKVK